MECLNCHKAEAAPDGPFCSMACASERYSIVMELLDLAMQRVNVLAVDISRLATLFR